MGLLSRLLNTGNSGAQKASVHDYTVVSPGREIVLVKQLTDSSKAFLSGRGKGLKPGDVVVVRDSKSMVPNSIRYRVETVNYVGSTGEWRAYVQLLMARVPSRNQFTPKGKR